MPPKYPSAIKDEMNILLSFLIELGLANDQNFPLLRQLSTEGWEVSFPCAEWISLAMDDIDYEDIHRELSEKRVYNVKFLDEGLLQMMYRFKENRLVRHRLAYFPSPNLRNFLDAPEAYMEDELYLDIVARHIVPFPLRFDFDEEAACDVEHPKCHLTLGDVKDCRIPVSAPLSPRRFIGFVLRNFYKISGHNFLDELPNRQIVFSQCISNNERQIVYIAVPDGTAI